MNISRTAALSVRRRPGQAILIGVAIVVATAFAAAALLISLNAREALVAFGMSTPEAADAVVVPGGDLDPDAVIGIAEGVRALPGSDEVVVEYLGDVEVGVGGTTSTWKFTSDPGAGPLSVIADLTSGDPLKKGEVVLGTNTAERVGASVGDTLVAEGRELDVAAIAPVHEFGQDVAFISEEDAVALGDVMMPVKILVTGDLDLNALSAEADTSTVESGEAMRAGEARTVTDTSVGVFGALSVFVGLAALCAVVIVSSTFRILLARRAAELALLRCVGAAPSQVKRLVLLEAACIGLVGGVLGVAIGLAVSLTLVTAARSAGLVAAPFVSAPAGLLACVALAVICTIVAALPAARAAGRTSPVTALGQARSSEARPARLRARLIVASALALTAVATGAAGVLASRTQEALGLGLVALSGTLVFLALVVLGPLLIRGSAFMLRPLTSRSVPLRLAASNALRASRRTASMTTVLTLGVGLTAALVVGVAGATEDAREGVERNFPSEAIIPVSFVADPTQVVAHLSTHPAVEARVEGPDILIDPASGADLATLRSAVHDSTDQGTPVFWAADVREGIEQMILIGQAIGATMIGVTVLVAIIGLMVTLALSVAERRQEIALLRALGVSRSGVRRSVAAEASLAAVVGATIGVTLGSGYGLLALHALGLAGGQPPLGALAVLVVAVIAAAVLAATMPMRNAGRVQPAIGLAAR
ncbi:FtsX-like permease family protein [Nocardiopsis sp. L17-MgMaSL7]|uniref:FtsX-like permease family protein n=1 Tax=Nocardiopsis sp. L17-MgMaSL7 TaxID=1938893 RepID=UPI000D709F21|nr:FtsX-like permease family protein [Nocardiopsis sp. L17-MgMaSL7]PWV58081.1 putative ABC transport system permease protein [Nocardiopsis sp. L17-MgMaSL7]